MTRDELVKAIETKRAELADLESRLNVVMGVDLLSLMWVVEPASATGAVVSLRDLRAVAGLSRDAFDAMVLRLATAGTVNLHKYDDPSRATADMVADGRGNHFIAISRAD